MTRIASRSADYGREDQLERGRSLRRGRRDLAQTGEGFARREGDRDGGATPRPDYRPARQQEPRVHSGSGGKDRQGGHLYISDRLSVITAFTATSVAEFRSGIPLQVVVFACW